MSAPFFDGSQPCAQTDPELFFPARGEVTSTAKRLCVSCGFVGECLEYAMADPDLPGIWGATTAYQREALRRTRAS